MSVTSITRAYNIMKLCQGAFYHPKTYAVRAFIMAVRAGFEPTTRQSKCLVLPTTPTDYKARSFQIATLMICIKRELLPANRVFGVYLALSGSATSVPVCFSIG